ncbi:MAG: hypothetical protein F2753_02260 [Actinobacteria bacterium]|nr:hypothetical protein [Actinomycetota bacterium]
MARLSESEARKIMRAAGLKPLEPYEDSKTPWLSKCMKCKHEVSPNLNNVKKTKTACKYCSGNATHPEDAIKIMKNAKLKPIGKFPGGNISWKAKCLICGASVAPKVKQLKQGIGGCKTCGRVKAGLSNRINTNDAIKIMKSVGLIPIEPYKSSNTPWKSRCLKCKKIVSPHFGLVKSRGSGCAYCAETRVDPIDAEKLFNKAKLKPLTGYPGNKVPWKSIHIPCGREVSPSYLAIKRGQGPCKYCSGVAVLPKDAEKVFLDNGLKPLVPYPGGNKIPWKSIHIPCGREVSPKFNIIQTGGSSGCKHCGDGYVDPNEAYQFFLSKDLQPLVPYPGSAIPWKSIHLICGSEIKPRYGHIKSGRTGCLICAGTVPITQEKAFAFFRSHDLEPQEAFKGPHHPWKSIHTKCGHKVSPQWASVQQGGSGCAYCAGNRVDMKEVRVLMKKLELKPLEPYKDSKTPWKCLHIKCGNEVSPTYQSLRGGQKGCEACGKNMVSETEAYSLLKKNSYTPIGEFPGGSNPWMCVHEVCGTKVEVRATYLRSGNVGCSFCAGTKPITSAQANKFFRSRGFKPIEPFKNARSPMKSIHLVCGREVTPTWSSLRVSGGCKYCSTSLVNLIAPAYFYLITNSQLNSHKVGISGHGATVNRLERHKRLGWSEYAVKDLDTGEEAYALEEQVLEWLRLEMRIPQYLISDQMPQGGHTETLDASEIDLATIWIKVEELSKVKK